MRNDKITRIVLISLAILLLVYVFSVLFNPKNYESPNDYFLKKEKTDKIYLEFFEGGDIRYNSRISNNLYVLKEDKEIENFYSLLTSFESDFWAPHRVSDYSVFIYLNKYEDSKHSISMSRINDDYVFFFRKGKYRNKELANKLIEFLEITKKEDISGVYLE